MAESSPSRASRSRSRSPSQHSDGESGARLDPEHSADDEREPTPTFEDGEVRGRPEVDRRASNYSITTKDVQYDPKRSTQLAENTRYIKPQPNRQPRNGLPNPAVRQPRQPAGGPHLEHPRPNPNYSYPRDRAVSNASTAPAALSGSQTNGNYRNHQPARDRPLRDINDTRGRRDTRPSQRNDDNIIFTLFNRLEHYSIDIHEWKDGNGDYYHAFQYYRGAPSAGYRSPNNQLSERTRDYVGRYSPAYPLPESKKRERSPERVEPARYERSPKRARSVETSYADSSDPFMQRQFQVPVHSRGNDPAPHPSISQRSPSLVDQFERFLQSSQRANSTNEPVGRPYSQYRY